MIVSVAIQRDHQAVLWILLAWLPPTPVVRGLYYRVMLGYTASMGSGVE